MYVTDQIFCGVTYVTGYCRLTLQLPEGLHVANSLQDTGLYEKYGLQKSPCGGGKPYLASGLWLTVCSSLPRKSVVS